MRVGTTAPAAADPPATADTAGTAVGDARQSRGAAPAVDARPRRGVLATLSSYRVRLLGWFVVLLALGTAATVAVVGEVLLERIDERIQRELAQETEELRQLAGGNDPATGEPFGDDVQRLFDVFLQRNIPNRNEVMVAFVDGQVYRRSTPDPAYPLDSDPDFIALVADVPFPTGGRFSSPAGAVDYLAVPVRMPREQEGTFAVAIFRDIERATQYDVIPAAASVGIVLLVIGSLLAWRLADRVLEPVRRTTTTARSISETDLGRRVEVHGNDEVAELAQTFNEMLDRISSAFEGQRRFMNDVGHELRTPLTVLRGHLELLDESPSAEERQRTLELVIDEVDRMTRLVTHLATLATAIRPDFVRRADVRADELVRGIYEKAKVLDARDWQLEIVRSRTISCDRDRITQAMLQLVENAIRYTTPTDTIALGCDVDRDIARLWVRDTGKGVALEEQRAIFQRFYQSEQAPRSRGSGLGLSIVQAIAEAHGGVVELRSEPGQGALFMIIVPAAGHEAVTQAAPRP